MNASNTLSITLISKVSEKIFMKFEWHVLRQYVFAITQIKAKEKYMILN